MGKCEYCWLLLEGFYWIKEYALMSLPNQNVVEFNTVS
jgi:hypothetical protein